MKTLFLAFAALFLATAPAAAQETVETPIGEQVAVQPGLDADAEAEDLPEWIGIDASQGYNGPTGAMGIQQQYTEVGQRALGFHNNWLMPLITAISLFVLVLLLYAMVRFRRSAHPEPSKTSHNTVIEVIWTVLPALILLVIAFPSIGLIRAQYSPPPADVVVKVTGHQWYWEYEYPDHGGFSFVSNMLREADDPALTEGQRFRTDADGPALLAVDERLVIPAGQTVKFLLTANDVIHSFAMPAFWLKMDTVPGRLNETWVKVDEPGLYFGQCSELCGARHAYMPIAIEVVTPAEFRRYVASKGGAMPDEIARREAAEAAAAQAEADAAEAEAGDDADLEGTPPEAEPNEAPAAQPIA
ncbi:cytochrome c oxidase subunit II [Sphingomicrobium sp. XHP0239]|uniref:cytochrome c oxidase subunit II n=1 Tax=Sphingomicrobium maritimum TaxID=3133972 RepID=UPI0031CCBBA5